jgi:hypothetical protein
LSDFKESNEAKIISAGKWQENGGSKMGRERVEAEADYEDEEDEEEQEEAMACGGGCR